MSVNEQNVRRVRGLVEEAEKKEGVVPVSHRVIEVRILVASHSDREARQPVNVVDRGVGVGQFHATKPLVEMVVSYIEHVLQLAAGGGRVGGGTSYLETAAYEAVIFYGLWLVDNGVHCLATFPLRAAITSVDDGTSQQCELMSVGDQATSAE